MYNYPERCKILFYIKINAFYKVDGCCLYAGYFLCISVVFVFKPSFLKKKPSPEEHPQSVKQFGSRSVQQIVRPDLDQCFLQRLYGEGNPYFDTLIA